MATPKYDVFISYSHKDKDLVQPFVTSLEYFGFKVWFDRVKVENGDDFPVEITNAILASECLIFMHSKNSNDGLWSQKELSFALTNKKQVYRIILEDDIPQNRVIEFMTSDVHVTHLSDKTAMQQLLRKLIDAKLGENMVIQKSPKSPASQPVSGAEIDIETDMDCRVMRLRKELIVARANESNTIHLPKGNHKLTFVCLADPTIFHEQRYEVKDIQFTDYIEVSLKDEYEAKMEAERKAREEAERKAIEEAERKEWKQLESWKPFKDDNGKYGFKDAEGKIVIPCQFEYAWPFFEGLAAVKQGGKWGYIDKSGKIVIPCQFDSAWRFSEGLAPVKQGRKWGFIDKSGKIVIPCQFDDAEYFENGKANVKQNGEIFYIDRQGN